jgi:ribosome biogenesis ATPase
MQACEGFSGADLAALVREAQLCALRLAISSGTTNKIEITSDDFDLALSKVFPSVSKKDELKYQSLESSLRKTRASITQQ